jgi:mono/diheme cytochrome c family protein
MTLGQELFTRQWRPNDPRCHGGDGLGPVYNATSCVDCHNHGGPGGGGPAERNVELATGIGYMVFRDTSVIVDRDGNGWGGGFDQVADPVDLVKVHPGFRDARSAVLHRFGVDPDYSRWRSTFLSRCRMAPRVQTASISRSGRRQRTVRASSRDGKPASRPIPPARSRAALDRQLAATVRDVAGGLGMNRVAFRLTARNIPPLFGAGLIDGLPDSELEQSARDQPRETRGRVHRLKDGRLGRFGWKAQVASLEDFVLTACANELGLEVPGHDQAISPLVPDAQPRGLDLTAEECAALVDYVRSLPPPVSLDPSDAQAEAAVAEGRKLFHSTGCASCHTANLGSIRGIYSDLLLHDMGEELSDSGTYYGKDSDSLGTTRLSREWRTPPLWGFRDAAPYLHDGRARNLEEAVALHDGQGAASASRFRSLSDLGRSRVETFLNSLVAPGAASAPHRAGEAARHPAKQPGADPAPPPGHGAARRGYVLGGS